VSRPVTVQARIGGFFVSATRLVARGRQAPLSPHGCGPPSDSLVSERAESAPCADSSLCRTRRAHLPTTDAHPYPRGQFEMVERISHSNPVCMHTHDARRIGVQTGDLLRSARKSATTLRAPGSPRPSCLVLLANPCTRCGEEIIDRRDVQVSDRPRCLSCAGDADYVRRDPAVIRTGSRKS
jgi:hypothetical protein